VERRRRINLTIDRLYGPPGLIDRDGLELTTLMRRYAAGDERAYRSLYARIAPRVRRDVRARVHDPRAVEDLVQVVFLRAHTGRSRYRTREQHADSALLAWFRAITRNTVHNFLRARTRERMRWGREAEAAFDRARDEADDPETAMLAITLAEERRLRVRAAIKRLPCAQGDVIRLHKLEGWSMARIARRLGVRRGTVRVRAHRGYTILREQAERFHLEALLRGATT
jgi:RNA polymerase sigma-70 factor, ECF subfamily